MVNCGHEEIKNKWLKKRNQGRKPVGPSKSIKIRPQRQKTAGRRYGAKNVIGKPRHPQEVYQEHDDLLSALDNFVQD